MTAPVEPVTDTNPGRLHKIGQGIKKAALWLGRKIVILWNNYLLPALKVLAAFLRTGYGIATSAALIGVTMLAIANKKSLSTRMRVVFNIVAIICFVGAGAALTTGWVVLI